MPDLLAHVLNRIDTLNKEDPHGIDTAEGSQPYEFLYSVWLTDWVLRLNPHASEALRIAARGQHVARWRIPRSVYDATRGGYLRWREDLKKMHAETVTTIMMEAGYPEAELERVCEIILKKNLPTNPDSQTIEDALCLVFLEHQMQELQSKTSEDKFNSILEKTWKKMSPRGREEAVNLKLPADISAWLKAHGHS